MKACSVRYPDHRASRSKSIVPEGEINERECHCSYYTRIEPLDPVPRRSRDDLGDAVLFSSIESIESMCSVDRMRMPYTFGPSTTVSSLEALTFCNNWRLTVRFPRKILNYLIVKRYTGV
jgi:hypothetical protein